MTDENMDYAVSQVAESLLYARQEGRLKQGEIADVAQRALVIHATCRGTGLDGLREALRRVLVRFNTIIKNGEKC